MQLHQIKRKNKNRKKKKIGRGGKRGTYSGRGIKGQKSRAGRKIRPQLRDVIKKLPKKKGYRFKSIKKKLNIVNLGLIDESFSNGEKVNPMTLFKKGLINKEKGFLPEVKLLGNGILKKKLLVSQCQISKLAAEKIKKVGGNVE